MKEASTSSLLRPEEIEDVYHFLYFHWFGHVLIFAGSLIAAWVTDNNLITGAAVLVFEVWPVHAILGISRGRVAGH